MLGLGRSRGEERGKTIVRLYTWAVALYSSPGLRRRQGEYVGFTALTSNLPQAVL